MTVMITTVYECFPPPSRLSVVMDGARRRFFLPLPSSRPLDFPIRREQILPRFTRVLIFRSPAPPLLSSHPPLQFPFYYKKDVTYMSLPNTPSYSLSILFSLSHACSYWSSEGQNLLWPSPTRLKNILWAPKLAKLIMCHYWSTAQRPLLLIHSTPQRISI